MTMNIFSRCGTPVTGKYFIGRDEFLNIIYDRVCGCNNNSYFGVARTGKTSLFQEAMCRFSSKFESERIYLLYYTLYDHHIEELFSRIYNAIRKVLVKQNNKYEHLLHESEFCPQHDQLITNTINIISRCIELLEYLSEEQIRIRIIIDECDELPLIINQQSRVILNKWREFISSVAYPLCLKMTLISRRKLTLLAGYDNVGSTFSGVFNHYAIGGYTSTDIGLFWIEVDKIFTYAMSTGTKEMIKYFCGNSPFLLAQMVNNLIEFNDTRIAPEIVQRCFELNRVSFDDVYQHRFELLRELIHRDIDYRERFVGVDKILMKYLKGYKLFDSACHECMYFYETYLAHMSVHIEKSEFLPHDMCNLLRIDIESLMRRINQSISTMEGINNETVVKRYKEYILKLEKILSGLKQSPTQKDFDEIESLINEIRQNIDEEIDY